jgi:hypothetical protein
VRETGWRIGWLEGVLQSVPTAIWWEIRWLEIASKTPRLPARSPNLNSNAERWVRSVKEECLSRLILFGESSLRRALQQYIVPYHEERNHPGKDNRILFPSQTEARRIFSRERLGGLLKYYEREAA